MQRESVTRNDTETTVGIDVSKAFLDVAIRPEDAVLRLPNTPQGHAALLSALNERTVTRIALEATGRFHMPLHQALDRAGLPVAVLNPYRARKFADVHGQLAKTDQIDARMLALYAHQIRPDPTPAPSQAQRHVSELVQARTGLVADQTALKNRLAAATCQPLKALYRKRLANVAGDIARVEKALRAAIRADPALVRRRAILCSIPGIGETSAFSLIALMPELGIRSNKEIAALLGVAPMNWDSGTMRGRRAIRGGRHHARKALYMPALTAATQIVGTPFAETYKALVARGKPPKVALTAVMRKMIVTANTLIKNDRLWQHEHP